MYDEEAIVLEEAFSSEDYIRLLTLDSSKYKKLNKQLPMFMIS
jgi:hypothetical protein